MFKYKVILNTNFTVVNFVRTITKNRIYINSQ